VACSVGKFMVNPFYGRGVTLKSQWSEYGCQVAVCGEAVQIS
jgi:hypothetical protein